MKQKSVANLNGARQAISLDGWWDIADSVHPDQPPKEYRHRVPVPGLVHSATPVFESVDLFDSNRYTRQWVPPNHEYSEIFKEMKVPERAMPAYRRETRAGITYHERDYFWYRTTFHAPARRQVAVLEVSKAQYGSQVWVNGREAGVHLSCSTAAFYCVSSMLHWSQQNEVLIRVGAHPGVLYDDSCYGTGEGVDDENSRWPPGIWDSVTLHFSDNPHVEAVQVAPRISAGQVIVQTRVRNYGLETIRFELSQGIHEWDNAGVLAEKMQAVVLAAGEEKTIVQALGLPNPKLWTPENPNLYIVETHTGGDAVTTRFGMREFRFDTPTRRAYLNGKPYFLRGGGIALNRFFDDPKSGQHPWDEAWVRKLLITIPRKMGWNSLRAFSGALPKKWLDIADEAGLLIQYEYPMTYAFDLSDAAVGHLIAEYSLWMRDSWNHPSVAIWDACNESRLSVLSEKIIPQVRSRDLSERPWESGGYGPPAGSNDPVEDHPYKFIRNVLTETGMRKFGHAAPFDMIELESGSGGECAPQTYPTGHALIINEYCWLWLNRDGSPTLLTQALYRELPYPVATAEERLETGAYLLAGLTEYWRAHRRYAGVMHYSYLLSSHPWAAVSDSFADVESLQLNPYFESYVSEAFKPLGVYINFWQRTLKVGQKRPIRVMMVNDYDQAKCGTLQLLLQDDSKTRSLLHGCAYEVAPYGQETYTFHIQAPERSGKFLLQAIATSSEEDGAGPTVSRRHVEVVT